MTVPPTKQLQLHTTTIRVCSECALEPPRHQYFCSAVREYSRSQILRELMAMEDAGARYAYWQWAWWIGVDANESTREQRADVRGEVAEERARLLRRRKADQEDAAA